MIDRFGPISYRKIGNGILNDKRREIMKQLIKLNVRPFSNNFVLYTFSKGTSDLSVSHEVLPGEHASQSGPATPGKQVQVAVASSHVGRAAPIPHWQATQPSVPVLSSPT